MEERRISLPKRLGARLMDWGLFALILESSTWFIHGFIDPIVYFIGFLLVPILFIPIEAILLSRFQTTIGRAVFGIRCKEEGREKLSFKGAFGVAFFFLKKRADLSFVFSMQKKPRLIATLAMLVLVGGISIGNLFFPITQPRALVEHADGWVKFVSSQGKFSIDFPVEPAFELKSMEIPQAGTSLEMSEFSAAPADAKDVVYSVSYVTLPRTWLLARSQFIMKAALYVLYDQVFGKDLLSKEQTTHWGYLPAMNFVAKDGDQKIEGRIVLSGNRLFQLMVRHPQSPPKTKDTEESQKPLPEINPTNFFDSFVP